MTDLVDYVAALIRLADGQIVGKTRLQKFAYLLEAKGIGFGIDFDYHNFGPFSAELAFAVDDAESLGYITTEEHPGYHSVPYTIFKSTDEAPELDDEDQSEAISEALGVMSEFSALVLELAATAVYLRENGFPQTFWPEVKKRKALKATSQGLEAAKELIEKLAL